jgi:hypothetical protein
MTDLTGRQLAKAVLKGLKEVGEHFARDPTPTDGTVRGALAAFARIQRPKTMARANPSSGGTRSKR